VGRSIGRAMVCFHRLSVHTIVVSGTVWPAVCYASFDLGVGVESPV